MKGRYLLIAVAFLVIAAVVFVQVGDIQAVEAAAPAPICMDSLDEPTMSTIFLPYQLSPCGPPVEIPFYEEWVDSPHNDSEAAAWSYPYVLGTSCNKCHTTDGYLDYIGADGTPPNSGNETDNPVDENQTLQCVGCHNDVTLTKTSVEFPSGVTIKHLGDAARCMECHQGRESGVDVAEDIEDLGLTDDVDTVSEDLGFLNIHYYAAAATQYGALTYGGYQYIDYADDKRSPPGGPYDVNFRHVESYDECYECHDMHTLKLKLDECTSCHAGVETDDDLRDVRMLGSLADYDGDGDMDEGIYYELYDLVMMLYDGIQQYANQVSVKPICYDAHSHPYWFNDLDGNGVCEGDEIDRDNNAYNGWTARLLKAGYNYQVALKDPGGYTHNGKYLIQLMHDSIYDLNDSGIEPGIDMVTADRDDPGHFAGSEEAWRHWDEDEYKVSGGCSKCHSAEGIPLINHESGRNRDGEITTVSDVAITQEAANGMECHTCHNTKEWPDRFEFPYATFPNGYEGNLMKDGSYDNNLCLQCHQGNTYGDQLDKASEGVGDDEVSDSVKFVNIHYFAAGATLFGEEANGIYEYEGKTYVGQNLHPFGSSMYATCTDCHSAHKLEVEYQSCNGCHGVITSPEDLVDIRMGSTPDYNGNGDTTEGVYYEIMGLAEDVYAGMQAYATANPETKDICYDSHSYPYWFTDSDGSGMCDPGEAIYANSYKTWTPRLARAAYNYQYALKDPGNYAHNNKYVGQALYDNLADLEASPYVDGLTVGKIRPE